MTKSGQAFERIYSVVSQIPKRKVLTYRDVANLAHINSPRIVGFALHNNRDPKNVPCHRVVRSDGKISQGYAFGGPGKQLEKLKNEGVRFLQNGRVDLSKSLFNTS